MENDVGSLKDEFPDKYLFAEDLLGKPATLTIGALNRDDLVTPQGKKRAVIVTFVGKKKLLVLNKTNAHLIDAIFPLAPGESLKSWVGKRITLYPTQCSMKGEIVDCIRVYGSPDLPADKEVMVQQGLKKVPMKLRAIKAGAKPETNSKPETNQQQSRAADPPADILASMNPATDVLDAWDALGWSKEEGAADLSKWPGGYKDPAYLSHLSALIDQMNAQESA